MGADAPYKVMEKSKSEYIKIGDINTEKNCIGNQYANTYVGNIYHNGSGFKYY